MSTRLSILLLLLICCVSAVAYADYVFEFSGYIDQVNENTNNAILDAIINQPFNGWFSYSSVPDQSPGIYDQNASISVTLGATTYSYIDKHVYISVLNGYSSYDSFRLGVDADLDEYINFATFGIKLVDHTESVFANSELPVTLDLSRFDSAFFNMVGWKHAEPNGNFDYYFDIRGTITDVTPVPEPATLLLLGFGGMTLLRKNRV